MKKLIVVFYLSISMGFAAQNAIVTVPRAVVYSDHKLLSPIGFLKEGEVIRVGEKTRNQGQVLPFVYKKKVVYIKVQDIQTQSDVIQLSHNEYSKQNTLLNKLNTSGQRNRLNLSLGLFDPGKEYDDFLRKFNIQNKGERALQVDALYEAPFIGRSYLIGGAYFVKLSNPNISMDHLGARVGAGLLIASWKNYQFRGDLTAHYARDFSNKDTTIFYGLKSDVHVSYDIDVTYSARVGIGYQVIRTDSPEGKGVVNPKFPGLEGARLFLSGIYHF